MQRLSVSPRDDWQRIVESQGCFFHSVETKEASSPYWDESAYYSFSAKEISLLETASYALNDLCLKAVDHIVSHDLFETFQIPAALLPWIKTSWERDEHTIYGRFDFSYDGDQPPKLLEYNADTPTALLEAAVVQW